jgi:hypothetical protein
MYLIVIFLFSIIILVKLWRTRSFNILRMSFWLYIAYAFLIITHLFSGIHYNTGSIIRILPYFFLCLILIIIGERLGMHIKSPNVRNKLKISLNSLCIVSFVGSLILMFDILRLNEIRFGFRIVEMKISLIGVLGNVISSLGLIAWLSSLYENRIKRVKISLISYLALFSYISGGLLMASVIMFLWGTRKRNELSKVNPLTIIEKNPRQFALFIVLFLGLSYFFMIANSRSGITDVNIKVKQFEKGFNAKTSKETLNDINNLGFLSRLYSETLYYYSHELIRLDIFYQYYNYHPLFGLSQMEYLERRLQWLIGDQAKISWNEVEKAIEGRGKFNSHTWGTFITNFIMDFGRIGTLIACLLLGIIVGILYKIFKENENSSTVVRQCTICAGIVFSIQVSPVTELIWMVPFILSSFIKVTPKFAKS